MRLKVPFVRNLKKWKGNGWCGPLSLACILRYYGFNDKVEDIVNHAGSNGATCPQGLINFCLEKGFNVDYFAKKEINSENNRDYSERLKEFLKNAGIEKLEKDFLEKNKKFKNYKFSNKKLSIKDIENYLDNKKPVLIIHNVPFVFGVSEKLWPHYIAIVGYDKDNFIIHNHAKGNHRFQIVKKDIINNSWDFDGFGRTLIVPFLEI